MTTAVTAAVAVAVAVAIVSRGRGREGPSPGRHSGAAVGRDSGLRGQGRGRGPEVVAPGSCARRRAAAVFLVSIGFAAPPSWLCGRGRGVLGCAWLCNRSVLSAVWVRRNDHGRGWVGGRGGGSGRAAVVPGGSRGVDVSLHVGVRGDCH